MKLQLFRFLAGFCTLKFFLCGCLTYAYITSEGSPEQTGFWDHSGRNVPEIISGEQ